MWVWCYLYMYSIVCAHIYVCIVIVKKKRKRNTTPLSSQEKEEGARRKGMLLFRPKQKSRAFTSPLSLSSGTPTAEQKKKRKTLGRLERERRRRVRRRRIGSAAFTRRLDGVRGAGGGRGRGRGLLLLPAVAAAQASPSPAARRPLGQALVWYPRYAFLLDDWCSSTHHIVWLVLHCRIPQDLATSSGKCALYKWVRGNLLFSSFNFPPNFLYHIAALHYLCLSCFNRFLSFLVRACRGCVQESQGRQGRAGAGGGEAWTHHGDPLPLQLWKLWQNLCRCRRLKEARSCAQREAVYLSGAWLWEGSISTFCPHLLPCIM